MKAPAELPFAGCGYIKHGFQTQSTPTIAPRPSYLHFFSVIDLEDTPTMVLEPKQPTGGQ